MRTVAVSLLALALAVTCAAQEHKRVADKKFWLVAGTLAAAKTADMVTTRQMLDRGHYETNPVFGRHPSDARLSGVSAGFFGAEVFSAYTLKHLTNSRNRFLRTAGRFWWVYPSFRIEQHARLATHNARLR